MYNDITLKRIKRVYFFILNKHLFGIKELTLNGGIQNLKILSNIQKISLQNSFQLDFSKTFDRFERFYEIVLM